MPSKIFAKKENRHLTVNAKKRFIANFMNCKDRAFFFNENAKSLQKTKKNACK